MELEKKIPGVGWAFSQPIEDNMEEAVSGVKGELATKVYGSDLHVLEDEANKVAAIMSHVPGIKDLGVLKRHRAARSGLCRRSPGGRAISDQRGRYSGRNPNSSGRNCAHASLERRAGL